MLGNTVCTAQEWRSRLCRGDVVDSDNRSQLPGFSRAAVYNGGGGGGGSSAHGRTG